jgi:hypothetical protein
MTRLPDALQALGLEGEVTLAGYWVTLQGECWRVYVVEADWGAGFYTWCDNPRERAVERYEDPIVAIQAGLRRAAQPGPGKT